MNDRLYDLLRAIGRRVKILAIAGLARLVRPATIQPVPDWGARPHRILYLRYDHIGDMVLATGIVHAIKRAQPTVTIDMLASVRNAAVLDGNPDVGTVYRIDKKRPSSYLPALARVRRVRYDAVLDAMVTGPSLTSTLILWASGARHRIGVAHRGNDFALTLPVPPVQGATHYVDHSAALLSAFGVDPLREARIRAGRSVGVPAVTAAAGDGGSGWGVWRPRLFPTPAELAEAESIWQFVLAEVGQHGVAGRRRRLLVNVSAGTPLRFWPEERFIATIRGVLERRADLQVILLGAPADEPRKRRIAQACAVPVAQTASIRQMMALVATCDFVFTPDTSVTHIASAFRKPVVAMYVGDSVSHWGPYGTRALTVSTPEPALSALPVAPVLRALEQLLAPADAREARDTSVAGA